MQCAANEFFIVVEFRMIFTVVARVFSSLMYKKCIHQLWNNIFFQCDIIAYHSEHFLTFTNLNGK